MEINSVLIVEDNVDTLQWLEQCIKQAFSPHNVVLVETVADAVNMMQQNFDLAIVDLHLPDGNGTEVLQQLNQRQPNTMCVVATIFDDDEHLFPALQAGAQGYLLKDLSDKEFIAALSGIVEGKPPLSPAIARKLLRHFALPKICETVQITPREKEVLQMMGKGLQVKKIATKLDISHYTVADYIKSLYRKLNICSRAEAAVEALKRGLI